MFRSSPLHAVSFQSGGKSDVKKKEKERKMFIKSTYYFFFFYGQEVVTSRKVVSALSLRADVTSRLITVSICFLWSLFLLTVLVHKTSSFYLFLPAPNLSLHNPSRFWRDCFPLATLIFIIFLFF